MVPTMVLGAWAAALAGVNATNFVKDKRSLTKSNSLSYEYGKLTKSWSLNGLIWAITMPLFGWYGGMAELLGTWSICVAMMVFVDIKSLIFIPKIIIKNIRI